MTDDVSDPNAQFIQDFRANAGKVGGQFEGRDILLLHSTDAESGEPRIHPLTYQDLAGSFAIFASKAGASMDPRWYSNIVADADVTIEVGSETIEVRARVAKGEERERIWSRQKQSVAGFADYEAATERVIPVVILERRG